mmetsp:Transcript_35715/g.68720  ORF Transcript_35715/g.68720 Transcript_35715/m.68720 type:complete len:235 (-) Transcript_35715:1436-2140(-)
MFLHKLLEHARGVGVRDERQVRVGLEAALALLRLVDRCRCGRSSALAALRLCLRLFYSFLFVRSLFHLLIFVLVLSLALLLVLPFLLFLLLFLLRFFLHFPLLFLFLLASSLLLFARLRAGRLERHCCERAQRLVDVGHAVARGLEALVQHGAAVRRAREPRAAHLAQTAQRRQQHLQQLGAARVRVLFRVAVSLLAHDRELRGVKVALVARREHGEQRQRAVRVDAQRRKLAQ